MKIVHKKIGAFTVTEFQYKKLPLMARQLMLNLDLKISGYSALQLDELLSEFNSTMFALSANGTKETVIISKRPGAYIVGSNAIDHYKINFRTKNNRTFLNISEPIGTDINRHKQ